MLEKRKEDSESVGKYQGIVTSVVIAAIIIWVAPLLIPALSGSDSNSLFNSTGTLVPEEVATNIDELFQTVLWFARIVLLFAVIVAVVMLRVDPKRADPC
ncbi:hypothetical protein CENSYa_0674 [Cenarchaeum symbiosum A]|uniref:Uncharacterized protein n=1 Tax=Cenarchaeum symbiosum (strain A) TaxID=414004 RepID=A0RVE0_CENSY|nr:hypothetical protein CENSYa_0674 [Cenarchaeum symbiosum A]